MAADSINFADMDAFYDHVFTRKSEVPESLSKDVFRGAGTGVGRKYDLLTPLYEGKDWTYEFTRKYQPRTADILMRGSEFRLYSTSKGNLRLAQEVNGQVILIHRNFQDLNPDDAGYAAQIERINKTISKTWGKPMKTEERHLSLPEPVRMAYYHRFDGLRATRL